MKKKPYWFNYYRKKIHLSKDFIEKHKVSKDTEECFNIRVWYDGNKHDDISFFTIGVNKKTKRYGCGIDGVAIYDYKWNTDTELLDEIFSYMYYSKDDVNSDLIETYRKEIALLDKKVKKESKKIKCEKKEQKEDQVKNDSPLIERFCNFVDNILGL